MLFLETLDIVEKFKQTFDGKESRDYIIKSLRKKKKNKPKTFKKKGEKKK